MKKEITIRSLQDWDRDFSKRKGLEFPEEELILMSILKLIEEVGEASKALHEKDWENIQGEICDVVIFALKIANIAEDFHGVEELSKVFKKKIRYSEARQFNRETKIFNKPDGYQFK
jgi:NTP pyrophosphatase (non-canonical NTP hydrolase)